jgi:hypothetical protein
VRTIDTLMDKAVKNAATTPGASDVGATTGIYYIFIV